MELSERYIQSLEKEGYLTVYEESCAPATVYEGVAQLGQVAVCVTEGTAMVEFQNQQQTLVLGQRCTIPAHVPYIITAGTAGCQLVLAEA